MKSFKKFLSFIIATICIITSVTSCVNMSKEMNKLSEEIANGYLFEANIGASSASPKDEKAEESKDTDDSVGASSASPKEEKAEETNDTDDSVGASIASPSESKNYPIVDGSTANMPMMAQIRADFLGEDLETAENNVRVTTTDYSWRALIDGNADLLLVYEPSSETKEIIENSDVELEVVPIGVDALVFIGNENNKVDSLTTEQIQDIYTGKITNWKELGGDDLKIEAFQRPLNSGSQTLFLNLVMKDKKPMDPPTRYVSREMADLIEDLASYNEQNSAIGYSVFYYAKKMYEKPGLKLLTVDNITPSDETIANGEYPFLNQYYLVIRKNEPEDSETRKLFNYILSDKGTEAIKKSGYIPVKK